MQNNQVTKAMTFAYEKHINHVRRYTGEPYFTHLSQVAGIVAGADAKLYIHSASFQQVVAVAYLHDTVEDTDTTIEEIADEFGTTVSEGVWALTDPQPAYGNRIARKAYARFAIERASGWVQTIKCADIISNTSSIIAHDKDFAPVFLSEVKLTLDLVTKADPVIYQWAQQAVTKAYMELERWKLDQALSKMQKSNG